MNVLVVHRSPWIADGLAAALEARLGLRVSTAPTLPDAMQRRVNDVVVLDQACVVEEQLDGLLAAPGSPRVLVISTSDEDLLPLLAMGATGLLSEQEGIDGVVEGVRAVVRGEAHVPPALLGTLLRELVVERRKRPHAAEAVESLSPREHEVLALLGSGLDTHQIADRLVISPHTARTHVTRLLGKLSLGSRAEAAALAVRVGLAPVTGGATDA